MLEKIEQIHALLNVPNVDADTETAITNMKRLNLLVDLRAEAEQLILSGVVASLPTNKDIFIMIGDNPTKKVYCAFESLKEAQKKSKEMPLIIEKVKLYG